MIYNKIKKNNRRLCSKHIELKNKFIIGEKDNIQDYDLKEKPISF